MAETDYEVIADAGSAPIKLWTKGVPVDEGAKAQLRQTARMPFIHKWLAVMPDVHKGIGSTVGSVIPTKGAIVPAAVGVDIGCGMMALRSGLGAADLPDSLSGLRTAIEAAVPHGRTGGRGGRDKGAWGTPPEATAQVWSEALAPGFQAILDKYPKLAKSNHVSHLGTLGTGNHFIEVCLDEADRVWFMLHSGSRGVGNAIGRHFIELAKADMRRWFINLPDQDLAYFPEGTEHFADYVAAVGWAQRYAETNRRVMMVNVVAAAEAALGRTIEAEEEAVNCHHNYVALENHYGANVYVTRKGAVRARKGDLGIIPGSMGARSYIVRGRGNAESFHSCSHGAGRVMSRNEARRRVSLEEHLAATAGVECRKDDGVIDETPAAYKPIDAVMAAQADLVEVVHELRQVVCVKG